MSIFEIVMIMTLLAFANSASSSCKVACLENSRVLRDCVRQCDHVDEEDPQILSKIRACVRDADNKDYFWDDCWNDNDVDVERPVGLYDTVTFKIDSSYRKTTEVFDDATMVINYKLGRADYGSCGKSGKLMLVTGISPYTQQRGSYPAKSDDVKAVYITNYAVQSGSVVRIETPYRGGVDYKTNAGTCYLLADPHNVGDLSSSCHIPLKGHSKACVLWDSTCTVIGAASNVSGVIFSSKDVLERAAGVSCAGGKSFPVGSFDTYKGIAYSYVMAGNWSRPLGYPGGSCTLEFFNDEGMFRVVEANLKTMRVGDKSSIRLADLSNNDVEVYKGAGCFSDTGRLVGVYAKYDYVLGHTVLAPFQEITELV